MARCLGSWSGGMIGGILEGNGSIWLSLECLLSKSLLRDLSRGETLESVLLSSSFLAEVFWFLAWTLFKKEELDC